MIQVSVHMDPQRWPSAYVL